MNKPSDAAAATFGALCPPARRQTFRRTRTTLWFLNQPISSMQQRVKALAQRFRRADDIDYFVAAGHTDDETHT
jgi:hypothetical protein